MSETAQTQDKDERYTNHDVTHGIFAKYLQAENPNVPATRLSERFQEAKAATTEKRDIKETTQQLDRIRAPFPCPECGSSHVFYTEQINVARCDGCGLRIVDTDKTAQEWIEGR